MSNIQYEFSQIQHKRRQKEQIARAKLILLVGTVMAIGLVYYQLFYATAVHMPIA